MNIFNEVPTPCYLIDEVKIRQNCEILDTVQKKTGAKILLALKAYALPSTFPLISQYLCGVCASGPIEARLGREEFGKEVHTYAPAYSEEDFNEVVRYSDHIIFNSLNQLKLFKKRALQKKDIEIGMRVNPKHSEVKVKLYNPCAEGSRFGVLPGELKKEDLEGLHGLHFHALCEQGADVFVRVLNAFESHFGKFLDGLKWVNFGGGHHITREDYDVELLCKTITGFRKRYDGIDVYLEPGEAVVLNAGYLVSTVLDVLDRELKIAILDTSAETHMPDVLAMPYRPSIIGAGKPDEFGYTYRLGGISCLAGDVIGDYSFKSPLKRGDRLVFEDMALYSFVKNTTFNGVKLPHLIVFNSEKGSYKIVRSFGYEDYKSRIS
ncbi:MAG: carboxynorspermidine decarboxylase [bacterium]